MVDDGDKHKRDKKENETNEKDEHVGAGLEQSVIDGFFIDGLFKMHGNKAGEMNI